MTLILIGLSITVPKAEKVRKLSERQARKSRRMARIAERIRVKLRTSRRAEWAPAFRYSLLGLSVLLNLSSAMYFEYVINGYPEMVMYHDAAVFFVSCAFLLGGIFGMSKPRGTSWWQFSFGTKISALNFIVIGVITVWGTEHVILGVGEMILGAAATAIHPLFFKARKFLASFSDDVIDEHLGSHLTNSFVVIPSIGE